MSSPSQLIKHNLFSFSSDLHIPLDLDFSSGILAETEDREI